MNAQTSLKNVTLEKSIPPTSGSCASFFARKSFVTSVMNPQISSFQRSGSKATFVKRASRLMSSGTKSADTSNVAEPAAGLANVASSLAVPSGPSATTDAAKSGSTASK